MKVSAFTSGWSAPASRMRIRAFIPSLAARGIFVHEHPSDPDKYHPVPFGVPKTLWNARLLAGRARAFREARHSDVIWLERELVVGRSTLEPYLGTARQRVFDVDDAIWMYGKKNYSESIASQCAGVIAGNAFLAEHYRPFARLLWVVPTSVDTERWARPKDFRRSSTKFVVGWTGTSSNFPYLYAIEEGIAAFLATHTDAEMLVVADRPPEWKIIPKSQSRFVQWTSDGEPTAVHGMDVGLMPLADEEWAKGKCAAKMLVYMAASVPVVVSPVGVNQEVLAQGDVGYAARTAGEWQHGLQRLYDDQAAAQAMGARGQELVERAYSVKTSGEKLAEIFTTIANDRG